MDKINDLRNDIDLLDDKIMNLLDKRFIKTSLIGDLKQASSINVLDKDRETTIFNKTSKYSHYPELKVIYSAIMNESKKLQRK